MAAPSGQCLERVIRAGSALAVLSVLSLAEALGRGEDRPMDCRKTTEYLRHVGLMADEDVDLAAAALALANLSRPDTDPGPYRVHLDALVQDVTRDGK